MLFTGVKQNTCRVPRGNDDAKKVPICSKQCACSGDKRSADRDEHLVHLRNASGRSGIVLQLLGARLVCLWESGGAASERKRNKSLAQDQQLTYHDMCGDFGYALRRDFPG